MIIFHGYIFAAKLVINLYTIYFDLPIPKLCFKRTSYCFIRDVSVLIFYGITILIYYLFIIDKGNIFIRMLQILRVRIFWLDAGDRPIDNLDARLIILDGQVQLDIFRCRIIVAVRYRHLHADALQVQLIISSSLIVPQGALAGHFQGHRAGVFSHGYGEDVPPAGRPLEDTTLQLQRYIIFLAIHDGFEAGIRIFSIRELIFRGAALCIRSDLDIEQRGCVKRLERCFRRLDQLQRGRNTLFHRHLRLIVNDVHSHRLAGVCSVDGDGKGVSVVCTLCRRAIIEMLIALLQLICVVDGELAVAPQLGIGDGEHTVFTGDGLVVDNRDTIIGTDRHGRTTNGHRTSLAVHVHHQLARAGLAIGIMHQTVFVDLQIRLATLVDGGRDSRYRHRACGRIAIGIRHRDVERIAVVLAIGNVLMGSCVDDLVATVCSANDNQILVLTFGRDELVFSVTIISPYCKGVVLLPDFNRDRGHAFRGIQRKIVRTYRELFQRDLDGLRSILDKPLRLGDLQHRGVIQGIGRNRTCGGSPIRRDGDSKLIRQVGVPSPVIPIATIYGGVKRVGVVDLDRAIRRYG